MTGKSPFRARIEGETRNLEVQSSRPRKQVVRRVYSSVTQPWSLLQLQPHCPYPARTTETPVTSAFSTDTPASRGIEISIATQALILDSSLTYPQLRSRFLVSKLQGADYYRPVSSMHLQDGQVTLNTSRRTTTRGGSSRFVSPSVRKVRAITRLARLIRLCLPVCPFAAT